MKVFSSLTKNYRLFKDILDETMYILTSKQKRRMGYALFVIIISSFLELLSVTIILPFVQAIVSPDVVMNNKYVAYSCKVLGISEANDVLLLLGISIIALFIIKNAYIIYGKYVQAEFSTSLQKEISVEMLRSYMSRPYTFFLNTNSAVIKTGCNDAILSFYYIVQDLLGIATELLTCFLLGVYLIYTDWRTAVGSIVVMAVVMLAIVVGFKPAIKKAGNLAKGFSADKNKTLTQAVDGIKDIKVTKREHWFISSFEESVENFRKTALVYHALNGCPDRITEGVCVSGIIGIVCFRMISGDENMVYFVPKLAAFAMAAFKMLPSVGKITNRINDIVFNRPLQREVYLNFKEARKYQDEPGYVGYNDSDREKAMTADSLVKAYRDSDFEIKFDNILWKYSNSADPVLKDLCMSIRKGEAIGLVGASGAGKTTVADILLGLLKPQEGLVSIEDKDIFSIPFEWAKFVGYVPQTVYLIDDTIRANVAFGVGNFSDEEIWAALERAQLKEFVENLPDKLDTVVGERGVKFSGGQRQRVAIARALVSNPQLLVMDEATSALDNETESAVMESIENLIGNITMVIVAHRLTTIRKCDRVYEISGGKAIEKNKLDIVEINEDKK